MRFEVAKLKKKGNEQGIFMYKVRIWMEKEDEERTDGQGNQKCGMSRS